MNTENEFESMTGTNSDKENIKGILGKLKELVSSLQKEPEYKVEYVVRSVNTREISRREIRRLLDERPDIKKAWKRSGKSWTKFFKM